MDKIWFTSNQHVSISMCQHIYGMEVVETMNTSSTASYIHMPYASRLPGSSNRTLGSPTYHMSEFLRDTNIIRQEAVMNIPFFRAS